MQQDNKRANPFTKYKINYLDVKSKLLSRSLLWMSLGLIVIVLVAWFSSTNLFFLDFVISMTYGPMWFIFWLINIVILISLFYVIQNPKVNIMVPVVMYMMFAIYEGMFTTSLLVFFGGADNIKITKDLLLYMLVPSCVFLLMGIIAYTNLIDFSKLIPFVLFSSIGLMILMIFMFIFWWSNFLQALYLLISAAIFTIWIGYDLQMIARAQSFLPDYTDKKAINRLSFIFGVKLFVDFVRLLQIIIRLFSRLR